MRYPKTFKVKGKTWRLEYKWRLTDDNGVACDGLCVPKDRVIYLDRLIPKENKFKIFLHELNHAVLHESHLGEMGGVDGFTEEVICASLADHYDSMFKLNFKSAKD